MVEHLQQWHLPEERQQQQAGAEQDRFEQHGVVKLKAQS